MPIPRSSLRTRALLAAIGLGGLAGCANLAPTLVIPAAPVAAQWPATPSATASATAAATPVAQPGAVANAVTTTAPADLDWRSFVTDARLRGTLERALQNNRDLRVAALNIERARALYRVERSALFPEVSVGASGTRQRSPASTNGSGSGNGGANTSTQYRVDVGLAAYELDLFGRVRNLGDAALQNFFAVEENRQSTQISLVAEVATAWLTLAADTDRLQLARDTLSSQQASYELTRRTRELGGTSGLALAQAQTTVDAARVDAARFASLVVQDRNALELLAGAPLPDELLPSATVTPTSAVNAQNPAPAEPTPTSVSLLVEVPAGLPADVLQQRPDVRAAERVLRAANANIGAARAALYPRISLTASAGTQSRDLSNLFGNGTGVWSFAPQIDLPIFDAGRRRANVQVSEAQQAIEVANYEKTLQIAFREVADALAARGTLAEQLAAQQSLTDATRRAFTLSTALFRNGASSYLDVLDAQRAMYVAMQNLISLRLVEQGNRVALYRALGGG